MRAENSPLDAPGRYQQSHPHPYDIPEKLPLSSRVEIDKDLTATNHPVNSYYESSRG